MNFSKRFITASVVSSVLLFLSACGPDTLGEEYQIELPEVQYEGEIAIDGSSTVYPIMEAVTEEYQMIQPNVHVSVSSSGTGGGFKAFIAGSTDISNASRPIKDEEQQALKQAGIDFTEIEIAYDGLSIAVNPDNTWVDYLTVDELKKMWVESGTVKKWSDIREGWPDEEIRFFSPGTDSGTFDYFNEVILEDEQIVKKATLSEDDNILITGVTGEKHSIGYFGYAYFDLNRSLLKVVPIDGGNGPVEPTNETIESGEYSPLSRPLYIYVKNESLKKPEVYDYVRFLIENAGVLSEDVGYVSLPQERYDEFLQIIEGLK